MDIDDLITRAAAENVAPRTLHDIYVDHGYPHDHALYRRCTSHRTLQVGGRHHGALGRTILLPTRAKPYGTAYGPNPPVGQTKHPPITDWLPSRDLTVLDDVLKLIDSPIAARTIRQSHATVATLPAKQQKDMVDGSSAYGLQIEILKIKIKAAEDIASMTQDRLADAQREIESMRQQIASLMALIPRAA